MTNISPRRGLAAIISLVALTLVPHQGFAQLTSGDLTGLISDPSGAGVPNATVDAVNTTTGVKTSQTANSTGEYRFSNLPVGTYDLSVTASGFAGSSAKGVPVALNRIGTQNFSLQVGQTATTVEVSESVATIDTNTAQITNNYDQRFAEDLPNTSTGQGVINLSLLSAGVASGGGIGVGEGPSVGGQRPRANNFTIEGVDNNSKSVTGPLVYVPNDATQEFSVLQNVYQAEFGHSSGGQFNTIVKSGTNDFHGTAFEYFDNRDLNAIDQLFQNQGITKNPRYDQNRFGGNFGGPIKKNKLFFFTDWEYNPTGLTSTAGVTAPTAAGIAQLSALPGVSATNLKIFQQYTPVAPTADGGLQPYTLPNGTSISVPVGTANIAGPNFQNWLYGVASVDYSLSDKDQLRGRFIINKNDGFPPSAEPQLPAFFLSAPSRYYLATLSEYHNFTPSLTNEFRFGFNRYNQNIPEGNFQFPGLDKFPDIYFDDLGIQLGVYTSAPQFTIQNTYQFTDNVTWVKGKHTWKLGFDGRKIISPQSFTQRALGDYEYTQVTDFLYDLQPYDFAERSTGSFTYYGDQIATYFYGSDSWKVNHHLTLDLGLRWEFTSVPYAERLQKVNAVSNVPGLLTFGTPQPNWKNWGPRIGFAYSPGTSGNTSIRGGFSMSYDVLFDNLGILSAPPQFSQTVDRTCTTQFDYQCAPGFLQNGGIGPGTQASGFTPAQARANTSAFVPDQVLPYALNWTLGIQHVFAKDYTLEVRYVGTRGIHLPLQSQLNQYAVVTASNSLPTYITNPGQAVLNSLPLTLTQLNAEATATGTPNNSAGSEIPAFYNAGFQSKITAYEPQGWSFYNGLDVQLDRRFTNGLIFRGAYTWSHNIDNSTAEVFSTYLTPRRPEDFGNLSLDRATSALDRRQRFTLSLLYDVPLFSHSGNAFMKNIVGNWEVAPIYTYQTPEYYTVQSGIDANLNGDAVDRVVVNVNGVPGTGTGASPLTNSAGQVVAYVANNPTAQYITANKGTFPNAARNTLPGRPIDNIDLTAVKRFSYKERYKLEFQAQFLNFFNHPQFIAGRLNDVFLDSFNSPAYQTILKPNNPAFNDQESVFSSNPRAIQLVLKFKF
ncbi:MAG TPA: carboxypeptidase regulatory-like domain-containing protein [Bryobacteraceae bacterium]|jgi:hypothetical protein|nr:carboxypeptidase regulatory-like domain-containing protein [Bryobacteraceae bacterium]